MAPGRAGGQRQTRHYAGYTVLTRRKHWHRLCVLRSVRILWTCSQPQRSPRLGAGSLRPDREGKQPAPGPWTRVWVTEQRSPGQTTTVWAANPPRSSAAGTRLAATLESLFPASRLPLCRARALTQPFRPGAFQSGKKPRENGSRPETARKMPPNPCQSSPKGTSTLLPISLPWLPGAVSGEVLTGMKPPFTVKACR